MVRTLTLMTSLVLAMTAGMASAQTYPVRDCRGGTDVQLPMVPNGHDAIVAHATDDLVGPSIFDRFAQTEDGVAISITPERYENYGDQLADYMACETPFMRVTHAQMNIIAPETEVNDATRMVPVYFYGWSNGAHVVVARNRDRISDLNGSTIAVAPAALDFALQLAAGQDTAPEIIVTDTPSETFAQDADVAFAIVSSADALVLTGGSIGTGAEGSVDGAQEVISTTSASRVQGDLLVVRSDYLENNEDVVRGVVRALLKAEELFREDVKKQVVDFERAADMVIGTGIEEDMVALWRGVETVGLTGQVSWADANSQRSYRALINQGQALMVELGLLDQARGLLEPTIDFASLGDDLWDKRRVETTSFNQAAATAAVQSMSAEETEGNTIDTVTILFEPNQAVFNTESYRDEFEAALTNAQIYAGAVLSVEAHSSYLAYLRGVMQEDWPAARQKRELASLQNTSTARALAVRDALIKAAAELGIPIDPSQFVINGRGIEDPLGGFCGALPCPPRTEQEWKDSRRVIFRVIAMESEAEVFTPLNEW